MAKTVRAHVLGDTGLARRLGDRPLHHRLMKMIPGGRSESRITTDARRREYELPAPRARRLGILAIKRLGQDHSSEPVCEIPLMLPLDVSQVHPESLLDGHRQHRQPIFLAFAPSHDDLMPIEVQVFHAKLQTLL